MKKPKLVITDEKFLEACKLVELEPTKRQFSKWKRNTGLAFKNYKKITNALNQTT